MTNKEISGLVERTAAFFNTHATLPYQFRIEQLKKLDKALSASEKMLTDALYHDLHKTEMESYFTEIGIVKDEIHFFLKHLKKLMAPRRVSTPLTHFPASSRIYHEPYGTVLIMSPWNYPVNLTLTPLVGAIAAGNCAILKPSNYTPATAQCIANLISSTFSPEYISVVTGGREENTALLDHRVDYIFFTGGTTVGKLVMQAAAAHLTPVTLELGGKSPCIIEKTANLAVAARRILFGKILNGGQTCVAPDYVLIDESIKDAFITECAGVLKQFFLSEQAVAAQMPHIVNEKHFNRLTALVEGEKQVLTAGTADIQTHFFPLTLLDTVTFESPVMQEEIFGPILPLISFKELEWAINEVRCRPRPLSLYLFTCNSAVEKKILAEISFGGGCINDTIVHLATSAMPFGGIGNSGMGQYHGAYSFDTFSHKKSIMKKPLLLDIPLRYHPYSEKKLKWIKKFL